MLPASSPAPAPGRAHYPCLDGLRALAVLLVLYNHAPQLLGRGDGRDGRLWAASPGAWIGVDLFFVLSGFLITDILLRQRGQPGAFRRFWLRRALRIFPLAWLYLGVLAVVGWLVPGFEHLRAGELFVWSATYLLNFHIAAAGWTTATFGILWSLAVEEHFYLVWPLVALRARRRVVAWVLAGVVVTTPLLRWWLLPQVGQIGVYVLTFARWDTLACGALLALLHASPHWPAVRRAAVALALPAAGWIAWVVGKPVAAVEAGTGSWFQVVGYSVVAVAFAVWCALALAPGRLLMVLLGGSLLGRIGRISYGLYVWHVLTAEATRAGLAWAGLGGGLLPRAAAWLCVLFAVAAASYRWFEAPLLRCKDRIA